METNQRTTERDSVRRRYWTRSAGKAWPSARTDRSKASRSARSWKFKAARGLPQRIKADNGPAFISRALDTWTYFDKVKPDCSRSVTPKGNHYIEFFNGSFRDKCLNMDTFLSPRPTKHQFFLIQSGLRFGGRLTFDSLLTKLYTKVNISKNCWFTVLD
jgi:hypothetical protein